MARLPAVTANLDKPKAIVLELHRKRFNGECQHLRTMIDEAKNFVECMDCKTHLNPMWVLSRLAMEESRFVQSYERYKSEAAAYSLKARTKCEHCGKITRIKPPRKPTVY